MWQHLAYGRCLSLLMAQGEDWVGGNPWAALCPQRARRDSSLSLVQLITGQHKTQMSQGPLSFLETNSHSYPSAKLGDSDHTPVSPIDQGQILLRPLRAGPCLLDSQGRAVSPQSLRAGHVPLSPRARRCSLDPQSRTMSPQSSGAALCLRPQWQAGVPSASQGSVGLPGKVASSLCGLLQ